MEVKGPESPPAASDSHGRLVRQEQAKKWCENPSSVPFCHFVSYGKEIEKRRFYFFNQWRLLPSVDDNLRRAIFPAALPSEFSRFREIEPYEHSRVKVPLRADELEYGDYYNASHISSGKVPYIACEAPTQKSLTAFWNMVWSQKVKIIVMLSDSVKSKNLFVYWPMKNKGYNSGVKTELTLRLLKLSETTSTMKLSLTSEANVSGGGAGEIGGGEVKGGGGPGAGEVTIVERKMEMWEQAEPNKKHSLIHLQFASWPENTNPSLEALNIFMEKYRSTRAQLLEEDPYHQQLQSSSSGDTSNGSSGKGCVLAHCTNGVGKTGAFLAIDIILDQIVEDGLSTPISVFGVVAKLRKERMLMVQTDEQYAFIHKFIEYRWLNCLGPCPPLTRQPTAQQFRAAGILSEYEAYRNFLKLTPTFVIRTKLVRLVTDNLSVVLKNAYAHRLKSVLYYTWRGLIKSLLDIFDRDTKWNLEFMFGLADRGSTTTLASLAQYLESAVALWGKTDVTEEDLWVSLHTVELDIYCCCRDMLEQTKMLTPRNRPEEVEERQYLLLENRLDRLFWYRFFLRRSEVPIEEFAKALRIYLEVGSHAESISLSDAQFVHMFTMSLATPQDSRPTRVSPRSFYTFLQRYGQLGTVYARMKAMCLCNGELAPWFRPELSREMMETVSDFPINGFNFLLRLSTDNMTFVLHCEGAEGSGDRGKKPPLKIHRDGKGYFWEAIEKTNQRLDDMRSLLYKYVLEVKNTYKEERSAIDAEMKDWLDQDEKYLEYLQIQEETNSGRGSIGSGGGGNGNEKPLSRLALLFSSKLFQDDYFDMFYNQFKPNSEHVEKMFGYIDKDKNTTLDSHEIRVGLYLLFSPLLDDLSSLVHRLIRKDVPGWGSKRLKEQLRTLSNKLIGWLPMAGSQLFTLVMLEQEISRVAAKLCSHTMELVMACAEFRRIGFKMDLADIVVDSTSAFSTRLRGMSNAPSVSSQPAIETEEIEMTSTSPFTITVASSSSNNNNNNNTLAAPTSLFIPSFVAAPGERDSVHVSRDSSTKSISGGLLPEKKAKNSIATLIKAWQLRRKIKRKLTYNFQRWIHVLLQEVTTEMGYVEPQVQSKFEGYLALTCEIAFLPVTTAIYLYYYDTRGEKKKNGRFEVVTDNSAVNNSARNLLLQSSSSGSNLTIFTTTKKKEKFAGTNSVAIHQVTQFLKAIVFVVFWSVVYYGPWFAWIEVIEGNIVLNDAPFHWLEFSLPFLLWAFNLATVLVAQTLQKKVTEHELKWQIASLTIRQSEVEFRQMNSNENLRECLRLCINGKENIHHVCCPIYIELQQPWDCLTAISEDFLTNSEGTKNETPLQSEKYFRFVQQHVWSRLSFKSIKRLNFRPSRFSSSEKSMNSANSGGSRSNVNSSTRAGSVRNLQRMDSVRKSASATSEFAASMPSTEEMMRKKSLEDPSDERETKIKTWENVFFLVFCVSASFVHAILPGIYRWNMGFNFFGGKSFNQLIVNGTYYNETVLNNTFYNDTLSDSTSFSDTLLFNGTSYSEISYGSPSYIEVLSALFLALGNFCATMLLIMLMYGAIAHYQDVRRVLIRVLALSNAELSFIFHRWPRYLALDDHPNNLLFFTRVRDHAKGRVDASVLTVVSVTLVMNVVIIARLVAVQLGPLVSSAVLNVMNIYEALVLSVLIVVLFNIVVDLNTQVFLATTTVLQTLQLNLSRRLMEMEEVRSKQLSHKVNLVYEQRYTPVMEIQKYDQLASDEQHRSVFTMARPMLSRERSMAVQEVFDSTTDNTAENKNFRHPKDAKEAKLQRQEERRSRGKQEDDIREMDAFVTLVGSSVDKVRCAELPIEILGLSVDKIFRTRVLAAILAGVVSVFLQVVSTQK